MVCIYCDSKLGVSNSRSQKKTNTVWRRRSCPVCKATLTSVEAIDLSKAITLKNQAGRLEPFSRDKLFVSVYESCKHRKHAIKDAVALTDTIIGKLLRKVYAASLSRDEVVETVQQTLKRFDKAAAVYYTAYHQS